MHALQPMQLSSWKSTTPFFARNSADVGQIVMHGASSHWLQRMTEKWRLTFGNEPVSMYFTHVRFTPSGTSCSLLHAIVQAWQPMHESLSSRKPRRVMRAPSARRGWRGGSCRVRPLVGSGESTGHAPGADAVGSCAADQAP